MKIASSLVCLVAATALPTIVLAANPPAKPGPCDRACLEGFVNRYLDAMESNTVSDALFARDVKFTENGVRLPLGGEGLWYDMDGKGQYQFYVPDVETQQIAFIGSVRHGAAPATARRAATPSRLAALALRLKIVDDRITEVEQLAIRPDNTQQVTSGANAAPAPPPRFPPTGEAVDAMGRPHAVFFETIPADKRATREELIKSANYYFTGLARNDGKGYYNFTDDCVRFENGMDVLLGQPNAQGQRTRTKCKDQFANGSLNGVVSRIRDRRFVAVDRERGIVYAFGFFDHHQINWTWQLAELFKIEDGQIRRIEAVFLRAPFGINSGWSTYEQGISEQPQDVR